MKKLVLIAMMLMVLVMSGCAGLGPAAQQVPGFLFSETKTPAWDLTVNTSSDVAMKTGRATCQSILGLVAMGDCSIETAKKNGGITKVAYTDFEVKNILGIYAEYTTKVAGQ